MAVPAASENLDDEWDADYSENGHRPTGIGGDSLSTGNPMRVVLMAVLIFEVIVFGLAIPVMIMISDVPLQRPPHSEVGRRCSPSWRHGLLRSRVGYILGWAAQLAASLSDS